MQFWVDTFSPAYIEMVQDFPKPGNRRRGRGDAPSWEGQGLELGREGMELRIVGNRSAVADGCEGIVDYGESQVVLRAGHLRVTIQGEALQLKRLTASAAVVEGKIFQVAYTYGERGMA